MIPSDPSVAMVTCFQEEPDAVADVAVVVSTSPMVITAVEEESFSTRLNVHRVMVN